MPCCADDRPPTRQELREQAAGLVALVGAELGELAVAIGTHAASDDEHADFARKIRERVNRELAAKLRHFKEMIVIT
jgi:hypothetical protein